jgi:carboxymethylenebutenolidase
VRLVSERTDTPPGLLVRPAAAGDATLPGILVIHELWGLDAHIEDVTERFARAGYLAFAADLLAPRPPELAADRVRALETFYERTPREVWSDEAAFDVHLAAETDGDALRETRDSLMAAAADRQPLLARLEDAVRFLRERAPSVGSVGWCMGGALSARLTATGTPPDAAVMFYGTPPEPELHERLSAPLLGLFGEEDQRITQWVEPFGESMRALGKPWEAHVYAGAPHAFFNDTRSFYRVDAARDAWARTLAFFADRLAA